MSSRKAARAAALLASAADSVREGRFETARALCEQARALEPRNPDALALLGVIALQQGEAAAALELLERAVALAPEHPAGQTNLAYALVALQRYEEALAAFERAARLDPDNPDLPLGQGSCLGMLRRPAEAEAVLRRLIERHPRYAPGWFNLGNSLREQERYEEAAAAYTRAIELAPRFADARRNLGITLHKLGRYETAEAALRDALALEPANGALHLNLAVTLNALRRHAEAEALARKALVLDPALAHGWPILGRALAGQGRWREALACFENAVEKFPENADALGDLGDALARLGRIPDALAAFDRAYALGNVSSFTRFFRAAALFSAGRIAEGAEAYLGRYARTHFTERHPELPLAHELPADLHGQELTLVGEQGLGDEVFFLRYAPLLAARGGRLAYFGSPKLAAILSRCAALERVSADGGALPRSPCTILVGDLPHLLARAAASPWSAPAVRRVRSAAPALAAGLAWHCRVFWPELPPPLPLAPLPERVAAQSARLRELGPPPYLGLTWRAGTPPEEQRGVVWALFKEIALDAFAGVLRGIPGTLVSLQRRPRPGETEQLAAAAGKPVHDFSEANEDLEEVLALLAVLDDYIGVSNTNMHLRAGVGKTARVLVPWPAEWRWMVAGEESPWFPGFRVYRQKPDGDWSEALARLAQELQAGCDR